MLSSKDATLQLIQREISEVVQREKELKELYSQLESRPTTNGVSKTNTTVTNGVGNSPKTGRLFTQNPSTKGAMQRFIKSRGKVSNSPPGPKPKSTMWSKPESLELGKPIIPTGIQPRNGFIPIQERIRKEFLEMEERETELVLQRSKSQPDLLDMSDSYSPEPPMQLLPARPVSQLSDSAYDSSFCSPPASLKPARSLADLCDVDDEEDSPPGSSNLIKRWEGIIQRNQ